jgi:hypothetical protein
MMLIFTISTCLHGTLCESLLHWRIAIFAIHRMDFLLPLQSMIATSASLMLSPSTMTSTQQTSSLRHTSSFLVRSFLKFHFISFFFFFFFFSSVLIIRFRFSFSFPIHNWEFHHHHASSVVSAIALNVAIHAFCIALTALLALLRRMRRPYELLRIDAM